MDKLYLGVARENITPAVGCQLYGYRPNIFSTTVADELTATAFYFKQGSTEALMLSITVCLINTELSKNIAKLISEEFGIPEENCMLSATHTHSGPNTSGATGWGDIDKEYCSNIFIPRILAAVKQAKGAAVPVKMGVASGESLIGVNRREINLNNKVVLGQNKWGSFNPNMTVLSFANEQNKVVANIVHYGLHGTAAGPNTEITRDWSGIMVDSLEAESGAVTAFFNGPEGDVGPRLSNGRTTGNLSYVKELGDIAAKDAVSIFKKISSYKEVYLAVSNKNLLIPLKKRQSLESARELYENYKGLTVNVEGKIRAHLESVMKSYETEFTEEEFFPINQTLIALGDIVWASFPYEIFSEIGMRIDAAFETKSILSLSNTNGSEGYFITEDAAVRGGYEVNMFLYARIQPFCDNADYHLIKETINHIKGE